MASRKVIPMRKRFQPNLSFFFLLLVMIYIIVQVWGYVHKEHISIYEVNTTQISDDTPLYGMILRTEEVVKTKKDGYINYYNAEGNRVGTGDVVYTLDTNDEVSEILQKLQKTKTNTKGINAMREVIAGFQNTFSLSAYSQIENFRYDINNVFFQETNGNLYGDLKKSLKQSGQDKDFTRYTAEKSGVISYSIDGYESIRKEDITRELLDQYGQSTRQQIQTTERMKAGSPVYKLVTGNTWSLVISLSEEYYNTMKEMDSVRVAVLKDGTTFNASVELWDKGEDHYASLTTTRYMERYINDRFLQIELNLKTASGLKIPNSSLLEKEYYALPDDVITRGDEGIGIIKQVTDSEGRVNKQFISLGNYFLIDQKYYVDNRIVNGGDIIMNHKTGEDYIISSPESLQGVYCVNHGYGEFRPVDIRYQNNEYTIVSDSTAGGLNAYDHIVVDSTVLSDDDFIK